MSSKHINSPQSTPMQINIFSANHNKTTITMYYKLFISKNWLPFDKSNELNIERN